MYQILESLIVHAVLISPEVLMPNFKGSEIRSLISLFASSIPPKSSQRTSGIDEKSDEESDRQIWMNRRWFSEALRLIVPSHAMHTPVAWNDRISACSSFLNTTSSANELVDRFPQIVCSCFIVSPLDTFAMDSAVDCTRETGKWTASCRSPRSLLII